MRIGWPALLVAVLIGVTERLAFGAGDVDGLPVRGDRDFLRGAATRIGLPGLLVAVLIGVTAALAP